MKLSIALIIISLCGCNGHKHKCRWNLCPYNGVTVEQSRDAVVKYVGENSGDAYELDMLHIQYPDKDYEQLDSVLINHK